MRTPPEFLAYRLQAFVNTVGEHAEHAGLPTLIQAMIVPADMHRPQIAVTTSHRDNAPGVEEARCPHRRSLS
jgi:hypothetical protein